MFKSSFGAVSLETVSVSKRGTCLQATNGNGATILMDVIGTMIPDGTNAYYFGNKLILVTRWADMSDEEKHTVETGALTLVFHPYPIVQMNIKIDGCWGDVMVTLPHCISEYNDVETPVDELIFVFADKHDSDYIVSRSVALPAALQGFLQQVNKNSIKAISMDSSVASMRAVAANDSQRDFHDVLYDRCWEYTKEYYRKLRTVDPDHVPLGIYVEIDGNNTVVNLYQKSDGDEADKMSDEVKMYLSLAEKGLAEAQYSLGVCYERGDGVTQNPEKAVYWYRKAAQQNYAQAQYNLGVCLYDGVGVPEDRREAAELFLAAAEQGDMYAQYNYGVCCYLGHGTEQNVMAAVKWFQQAAMQGHPEAKKLLGQ